MFHMGVPMGMPIEIEWVADSEDASRWEPVGAWRINVADYEKNNAGKWQKALAKEGDESFTYSGKKYRKCPRKWRFCKRNA